MASNTWYPGWGFWYQSPTGSVNDATDISTTDPNATPTPGNPNPNDPNSPEGKSAKAIIRATLESYGLASLADWAWNEWLSGINENQIYLDMRETPEYAHRFPAMKKLQLRGQAISERDYINYETGARALFKAAGLPEGFYDQPDDFKMMLENDVALPELKDRIDVAKQAVYNFNPEALAALENFYGIGGNPTNLIGDLTAWAIDDQRALPIIQRQWVAAQTAGVADRTGYGGITRSEAERLADLGISQDQAQQGFGTLANMEQLFANLPGEAPGQPTREQGQQAVFEGSAQAAKTIEAQRSKRKAEFGGGGQFTSSKGGVTGVG